MSTTLYFILYVQDHATHRNFSCAGKTGAEVVTDDQRGHEVQAEASVVALDLTVDQMSLYASQRRLCITAALVKAVQEVQEGLLMLTKPPTSSVSVEVAPAAKVQPFHQPDSNVAHTRLEMCFTSCGCLRRQGTSGLIAPTQR